MTDKPGFLEPIYLNTSMVMNAAGYLFGGVATSDERTHTTGREGGGGAKAGLPFLQDIVGLAAEAKASATLAVREVRELTVGGLHMNVLDELRNQKMLKSMTIQTFEGFELEPGTYVEARVVLKPVEYHSILRLIQVVAPIIGQAASDFPKVRELFDRSAHNSNLLPALTASANNGSRTATRAAPQPSNSRSSNGGATVWQHYSEAVRTLADRLEEDFRRSQELEVVLEDPSTGQYFGIAGLSLDGYDIDQLRARITDVEAIVIGKVTRFASYDQTLPLLQQTAVMQLVELVRKLITLTTGQIADFDAKLELATRVVDGVISLRVDGPAIRIATMSVCI